MARKKTRLAYIADNTARNATLRKRRVGLLKKIHELSVLCDVPVCAVIYVPQETKPDVWPSPEEARVLFNKFNATEGFGKVNNMLNQEKLLAKRMVNLRSQLDRIMADNAQLVGDYLHLECLGGRPVSELDSNELGLIGCALARRSEAVQARLLQLSEGPMSPSPPILLPPPVVLSPAVDEGSEQAGEAAPTEGRSKVSGSCGGEAALTGSDLLNTEYLWAGTDICGMEQEELFPAPSQCDSKGGGGEALPADRDVMMDVEELFPWTDICGSEQEELLASPRQSDWTVSECGDGEAAAPGSGVVGVEDPIPWMDICWSESDNFLLPTWDDAETFKSRAQEISCKEK